MILDRIKNVEFYCGINRRLATGLRFLSETDSVSLPAGRHEIDGERIFALIQDYQTKPREQGAWEAHRRYFDIQFIVSGAEIIGCAPVELLSVKQPYSAEKDFLLLDAPEHSDVSFLHIPAGAFAVFAPPDAHMPGLAVDLPAPVRKVVVKVLA